MENIDTLIRVIDSCYNIIDKSLEDNKHLQNRIFELEGIVNILNKQSKAGECLYISGISVTPEQQFKIKSFWTGFRYSAKTPAHDDFEGKIPTIKFCREQWGWGLKDAKDIVEAIGYGS
jgi:ribosomal protein L7/L12